jgi:hypothetical protein
MERSKASYSLQKKRYIGIYVRRYIGINTCVYLPVALNKSLRRCDTNAGLTRRLAHVGILGVARR